MKKIFFTFCFVVSLTNNPINATFILKKGTFHRTGGHDDPSQNLKFYTISCTPSESTCFTANVNNGLNDTIMCVMANQPSLLLNHQTTIYSNGIILTSGQCKSIMSKEITIPGISEPINEVEFIFEQ
jgi:hypothetical protein